MRFNQTYSMISLMLVLFIDGLGQGIIFPLLSKTIINNHSALFFYHASSSTRHIWYGILISAYYLMWFLAAPLIGNWSDSVGRKKSLLLCLVLAAISFLTSALAFKIGSISLLLVSRLLGGATSGDQAIAKAAVIDSCSENNKSLYLGLVLLAVTLGLVAGPLVGEILQNSNLVSWFNVFTPLFFSSFLSLINIFLICRYFNEIKSNNELRKFHIKQTIKMIANTFSNNNIKILFLIYSATQLSWQIFYLDLQNYMTIGINLNIARSSVVLSSIGIGIAIGLGLLPRLFTKIDKKTISIIGYSGLFAGICQLLFLNNFFMICFVCIFCGASFGLAAVNTISLISSEGKQDQQGLIMGITGSVVALTGALGGLLAGILSNIGIQSPYKFCVLILFLAILLFSKFNKLEK